MSDDLIAASSYHEAKRDCLGLNRLDTNLKVFSIQNLKLVQFNTMD